MLAGDRRIREPVRAARLCEEHGAAGIVQLSEGQAAPPQVGVVTVQPESVTLTTVLPGRTSAYETSEVRPQVNGLVTARLFTEGDQVKKGQTLCLIEAMKMMSEIPAPCDCIIQAVLKEDGELVAFGDALVRYLPC